MIQSSTLQWLRDKASTSGQLWAVFTGKKQGLAWQSRCPASRSLIQSTGGSLLYHLLPQTLIFKSYLSPLVILSSKKLFTHCPLNWLTLIYLLKISETEVRLLKPSISPGQTYPQIKRIERPSYWSSKDYSELENLRTEFLNTHS